MHSALRSTPKRQQLHVGLTPRGLYGRLARVTVSNAWQGVVPISISMTAARRAGGLHVMVCQRNLSRRLDRQLQGRAGRQGDRGSTETWIVAADSKRLRDAVRAIGLRRGKYDIGSAFNGPQILLRLLAAWPQWAEERRLRALRCQLLEQDLQWEKRLKQIRKWWTR